MADDWEEEAVVVVELSGQVDREILKKENLNCQILGIDSDKPILQLDNFVFSGQYEEAIGTSLVFKATPSDPFTPSAQMKNLEFLCSTKKKLVMQRAFLQNKNIPETQVEIVNEDEEEQEEEGGEEAKTRQKSTDKVQGTQGSDNTAQTSTSEQDTSEVEMATGT